MQPDDLKDTQILTLIRGLYFLTLLGIGISVFTAADMAPTQHAVQWLWLLQALMFFGVLRALRTVALELMAAVDHE